MAETHIVMVKFVESGLPMVVEDQNSFDHSENITKFESNRYLL